LVALSCTDAYYITQLEKNLGKEEYCMGYGGTGGSGGCAPYFDGSFILFLVLILLVFGMGFMG